MVAADTAGMLDALVYTSRATPALTDAELEVVLLHSRTLNAMRGITGALLKRGDAIVQYLEGEPSQLARTLPAIVHSPLHRDMVVQARASGVARRFDTWHMGFCDFQSRHQRDTATGQWIDALPDAATIEPGNPALARLVVLWHELAHGAGAARQA